MRLCPSLSPETSILALISTMSAPPPVGQYVIYSNTGGEKLALTFQGSYKPITVETLVPNSAQIVCSPPSTQLVSILSLLVTVACSGRSRTLFPQFNKPSSPRTLLSFKLPGVLTNMSMSPTLQTLFGSSGRPIMATRMSLAHLGHAFHPHSLF